MEDFSWKRNYGKKFARARLLEGGCMPGFRMVAEVRVAMGSDETKPN